MQLSDALFQLEEHRAAAYISDYRDLCYLGVFIAHRGEIRNKLRRHIIYAEKTDVLQRLHHRGFTRAGKPGHYNEFHLLLLFWVR